jgi:ABC-type transporter Mla maintaining outer membrane lipid asymmetry ATPase subunit MlaF
MSGEGPLLAFDHVHLASHGEALIEDLDFRLGPGEALVVTGPAGSGKSAITALAAGLTRPGQGSVRLAGGDPADPAAGPALRATAGFAPRSGALLSNLTLADNVALPLRWHRGLSATAAQTSVEATYRLLGAEPPPSVQAARAAPDQRELARLARAMALRPPLLVVDEAGAGLDAALREDLWRLLWRLSEETGCAVLALTVDPGPARVLSERMIHLPPRRRTTLRILRHAP